jgi:hypothetical protein
VQQAAPARKERSVDDAPQRRIIQKAHVLEHADRDEHVVPTGHVAIVVLDVLDAIGEPVFTHPTPRITICSAEAPPCPAARCYNSFRVPAPGPGCVWNRDRHFVCAARIIWMTGRLSFAQGGGAPGVWARAARALELTVLATAAVAGLLTAGTLIGLRTGSTAIRAWLLFAGLALLGGALSRALPAATIARHRRPSLLFVAAALTWTLLGLVRPTLRVGEGLTAQYFANPTWDGWPAGTFVDTQISTARVRERWNGVPPERFSARWLGYLAVERSGRYRFTTTSDDGSRLYIDDQLVVDNGGVHSRATRAGEIELARGAHRVRLEYVQFGGDAELTWLWARAGGPDRFVPTWALSRRPAGYTTVLAARLVDAALPPLALLILFATAWYVYAGSTGKEFRRVIHAIAVNAMNGYRDRAAFVFSVVIFVAFLCVPWPGGSGHWSFFRSVATTIGDVHRNAARALGAFAMFQAKLKTPRAGEEVLPARVREIVAMLEAHGVDRYVFSRAVAVDPWVYQQIIASAWPRTSEHDAKARFLLNTETNPPGCSLIESRTEVSLVYCP